MLAVGQPKVRWIRFLVIILALTASRGNFPLIKPSKTSATNNLLSKVVPKYEGVVPSRRHLESQRADWLHARTSDHGLPTSPRLSLIGQESSLSLAGVRPDGDIDLFASSACPKYLKFYLPGATPSSLPPPA